MRDVAVSSGGRIPREEGLPVGVGGRAGAAERTHPTGADRGRT